MSTVSEDFVAFLNSRTNITAMVGNRIFQAPAHIDEDLPYIVFMRSGRPRERQLDGDKDLERTRLDVECRAVSQDEAERIGDALEDLLDGYSGTWGDNRRIQGVFCDDQEDDYIHLPPGSSRFEEVITTRVEIISE